MRIDVEAENLKGVDQVRIKAITDDYATGMIIVGADGWHYDKRDTVVDAERQDWHSSNPRGKQVRISANNVLRLTKSEWEALRDVIDNELADL